MGVNVKGFMLQPVGPEALGLVQRADQLAWPTSASIASAHLRAFPVRPIKTSVWPLLPWAAVTSCQRWKKAQSTRLNGAAPSLTSVFGFQKVLKHYYLQGLHQVVVNADLYINGDVYDSLTPIAAEGASKWPPMPR